ncbi:MAG: HD domain-containing protein [Anaerolineae bacterium]
MPAPTLTVPAARALMHAWTASPALRQHMEAVAACVAAYAADLAPAEVERWTVCGLLHDFDYERHPTPAEHPFVGVAHLRERGDVDEGVIEAILGHATYSGVPRTTPLARALFACDELAGFIVACGKVRPDGLASLDAAGVRKKLKNKAFAAAVSREDIALGIEEMGVDEEVHFAKCVGAIRDAGLG